MEMGSSSLGVQGASGPKDSIHGLKFGKKIYFEDVGFGGNGGGNATTTITSSAAAVAAGRPPATAPTRKGKSAGQERQQQPPRCQVEGCQVDLTDAKAYYCRHKVCGMHSKSPKVIGNGMEQRFCQQCSRFHLLPEFDQGKRSCRRRLAGHNERRRKPPLGPLSSRYGRLSLSFHDRGRYGGHLMDFNYPTLLAAARDVWPTLQTNNHLNPRHCIGMVYAPSTGMVSNQAVQLHGLCSAGGSIFADHDVHNGGHPGVVDSSCALSLLSNQPWGAAAANTSSRAPMISTNNYEAGTTMVQSTVAASISSNSWNFRGNQTPSCMHELSSEMGLGLTGSSLRSSNYHEIAHEHKPSNGQFSGELGLALQGSRECASSSNSAHWSL